MNKYLARSLKTFLYLILLLLVMVTIVAITIQTRYFKDRLRDVVVNQVNKNLNAELAVEIIDGNFFTNLEASGITLTARSDTILAVPHIRVTYAPLHYFIGEINIRSIVIDSLDMHLKRLPDSTWNLTSITQTDSPTESQPAAGNGEPFGYAVRLDSFRLMNSDIRISAQDSLLPSRISNLNIGASVFFSTSQQNFYLKELRFQSRCPDFTLNEFSFNINRNKEEIVLKDLLIRTDRNSLQGKSKYYTDVTSQSTGELRAPPLKLDEFSAFLPALHLPAEPKFSLSYKYLNKILKLDIALLDHEQQIRLNLEAANLESLLKDSSTTPVQYTLRANIKNVNLARWMGDATMDYLLNGRILLHGQDISRENTEVVLDATFSESRFLQYPVSEMILSANYRRGDLQSKISAQGEFGRLILDADMKDLLDSSAYKLRLDADRFDASAITGNDTLKTDLTVNAVISGKGTDQSQMTGDGLLKVAPSSVAGVIIDTLYSAVRYRGTDILFDTLHLESDLARLGLSGNVNPQGDSRLKLQTQLGNLMALKRILQVDTLHAAGQITAEISGKIDSLRITASADMDSIHFNENLAEKVIGTVSFTHTGNTFDGKGKIEIRNAGPPDFRLDEIALHSVFDKQSIDLVLDISRKDLNAHLESRVIQDTIPKIMLSNLSIDLNDQRWESAGKDARITIDNKTYHVENFQLTSTVADSIQSVSAEGVFSMTGSQDFLLQLKGIDIEKLATSAMIPVKLEGLFSLNLDLKGTAESPVITGNMDISSGRINAFSFKRFKGNMAYENQKLNWQLTMAPVDKERLFIDGLLPVNLSFVATRDELLAADVPLNINLKTERLPIKFIKSLDFPIKQADGYIQSDLKVAGTLNDPRPSGFVRMKEGALTIPLYGIDYRDIQLYVKVDSTTMVLEKLRAARSDGSLQVEGQVQFADSLIDGNIQDLQFQLSADRFFVSNHQHHQLQISGDAFLKGVLEEPRFGGNLQILRSSFFLPAFTGENDRARLSGETAVPLLVKEKRRNLVNQDTIRSKTQVQSVTEEEQPPDIYRNMRGTVKVSIPRNTWIKSPDLRLELSGDVDLVKNGPQFEIFGPIQIVRGHYDLLGRRFTIEEGKLIFQGGAEINPQVNLSASYVFRTPAREKRNLRFNVSGKALSPGITFTLDEEEITEGDAIAYIMFGRSMDELTAGQQEGIAGAGGDASAGAVAAGFAANLISAQLTQAVGKELNLDYIEVKSKDNWQSASFVVGKYITNDLFVSYQKEFGETQDDTTPREIVTMEYELTEFLFLQLLGNSKYNGFDMIFKFNRE